MTSRTILMSLTSFLGPRDDLELHRRVDRAAHLVDRLVERQPLHGIAVDAVMMSPDRMPALAAGVSSIGVTTLMSAVFLRHLDAEAAELALGLHLHVAEALASM